MFFRLKIALLVVVAVLCVAVHCHPLDDSDVAASGGHHHGRVQIKVYRGPSEHEHFAPWGFWVKQPHDDHHHH